MTVINTPETSVNKRYMVRSWFDLWHGASDREAISIEALAADLGLAGFDTRTVFDEDNEAFLLMVDTSEGTFEISPAYMVNIEDKETLVTYVSDMNIYRKDGSVLTNGMTSNTEKTILNIIENCF